jgi:predicted PurR-regulated permease PerM
LSETLKLTAEIIFGPLWGIMMGFLCRPIVAKVSKFLMPPTTIIGAIVYSMSVMSLIVLVWSPAIAYRNYYHSSRWMSQAFIIGFFAGVLLEKVCESQSKH